MLALKLKTSGPNSYSVLGESLGISASQAYAAAIRAQKSGLLTCELAVRHRALEQTLLAVPYFFPAVCGGPTRGIPTARACPEVEDLLEFRYAKVIGYDRTMAYPIGLAPVWPHPSGTVQGIACEPIYKTAPEASLKDVELYRLLALIDCLRLGTAREVEMATETIQWLL